jgi:signal transduction histidine kinase
MAMRLADFILRDMQRIVAQWEVFARTQLPAGARMGSLELRDHAEQILEAVAKDLRTSQTRDEQSQKSMGLAPIIANAPETAAETHALLRARSGFNIKQLAAEYRALRASVLRLWMDDCEPDALHVDDIIRFNEAIDQALAESIEFFTGQVEQARNLFLGMLGHDLRSPLQSIQMTATYLSALNAGENVSEAAHRLIRSGVRMHALLDDLLDFNRARLGLGIAVNPTDVDVASLCTDEVDELRAAYPDYQLNLQVTGDTRGRWDGRRLQQLLGNLIVNAIKYGKCDSPVQVVVIGDAGEVRIDVTNNGEPIDPLKLDTLFEPLTRGVQDANTDSSLGLGLYIAREIAKAHHGDIEASSGQGETTFKVRLPRP